MRKKIAFIAVWTILAASLVFNPKPAFSQETPVIYVDPQTVTGLSPSQNFNISIKIANITGLYGLDVRFSWNPAVLEYVSHVTKTPIDGTPPYPDGVLYKTVMIIKDEVNTTAGTYFVAATSLSPAPSFNGTGTLADITFHVKAIGRSPLNFTLTRLSDPYAQSIPHDQRNGFFDNYVPTPVPIYVSPKQVIDSELIPCTNFTVDVNVDGLFELETFEVWVGYNTSILDVENVTVNAVFPSPTTAIFETEGQIKIEASTSPSLTGDFTLASVTFHVTDTGESILDVYNVTLTDEWGEPMPYEDPVDGYFSNILKARLFIDPDEIIDPGLTPGSQFDIRVKIDEAIDLYGYEFNLSYDTAVLTCLGAVIIPPNNETHFIARMAIIDDAGMILVNVTYYPPAEPITLLSATEMVAIYFQVQSYGCTPLLLEDTKLINQEGAPIPHDVENGYFCTLIADVAIVKTEPSRNMTYEGWTVNVTVVAANLGDTTETFNVTAYYDSNIIGIKTVYDLPPTENITLTFGWDTTGLTPCQNYTLKAEASQVPYEVNVTNNIYFADASVKIKIFGDVNGDGTVDIFDIVLASAAYETSIGDPGYEPEADLAPVFGLIDIFDVVTVASQWGKTCGS